MKILYLEDNPNDALITQRTLGKATPAISVELAHTVQSAINKLQNPSAGYDLVLSDLNLPDGSGLDLLNYIRSGNLPYAVVVVTGQSDEDIAIAALKAGADDYIAKKEDYLLKLPLTLQSALERYHAEIALHSRALRVLFAESEIENVEDIRHHLAKHAAHIQLDFTSDQKELTETLAGDELNKKYDVIVLDYLLKDFNALEALKELYETRKLDIPVILITSHGNEEVVSRAVKLGASDYVVKNPGYLYKLSAVIENAFHRTELVREQAALRDAEARYRVLVEQSPAATYIDAIDDSSSTLFLSNRIEEICGYPISDWYEQPGFWVSKLHPDDYDRVLNEHRRTNITLEPFRMEYRLIAKDGKVVWVQDEAIVMRDDEGKPNHWQGLLLNITDQKLAEESLRRRDAIMEAISTAAEKFLVHSWRENIQSVLEQVGRASGVSRTYIFQNHVTDGRLLSDQIYEWVEPGTNPQINNPEMTNFDFIFAGFDRWIPQMSQGQPIIGSVRQMSDGEQAVFRSQGIQSIACMPIFVNMDWWGFIGFDECKVERDWRPAEIDALRTCANILGAAIQRMDSEIALQKQLNEITALQAVSAAGIKSTQLDELIASTTHTISNLLYPDNCGIFLYDDSSQALIRHPSYHGLVEGDQLIPISSDRGVVGSVYSNNAPLLIPDVALFDGYVSINKIIKSEMAVPLRIAERPVGVLNVESRYPAHFSSDDLQLLSTIGGQLSIAMEKNQLMENEHRRLQESETLRQAASVISTTLDLEIVLDTILTSVKKVVPYDSACIFLTEEESPAIHIVAAQGFKDNSQIVGMHFPQTAPLLRAVHEQRQVTIIDDVQTDPRYEQWGPELGNVHGWMGVPLISRDEVIGYLTLDNHQPGAYSTSNAVLTQTFAYQASAAISNATLYQETRRRLRELEVINRISSTLRSSTTVTEMLDHLLMETLDAIGSSAGSIWLYDPPLDKIVQKAAEGWFLNIQTMQVNRGEDIAGLIFKSGSTYSVMDFSRDASICEGNRKFIPPGWSGAGFPIRTSNEMIGVIIIAVHYPRQLSRGEYNLLGTIAEMAGNAIHRAQLFNRSEQQVNRLTALRDVDIAISSSFDLRTILDVIIDHVISQLQVDAARILLYNPVTQTLDMSVGRGFRTSIKFESTLRLSQTLAGKAALENRMIEVPDMRIEDSTPSQYTHEGFLSYFAVPLNAKGQIKGVLEVFLRQAFKPTTDWMGFLNSLGGQTAIAIDNLQLFTNLQRSNVELELAYDTTLEGWGKALEIRDQETEGHTQRVTEMTLKLARRLGYDGEDLIHIRRGTLLHDIGKMGIPDEILRKPGTLSAQEWVIMRKHVDYAYALLNPIEYLQNAIDIPYCHHERWNGSGYPRGLRGEDIPTPARIFAVVDVWDALLSDRPYRSAWARAKVIEYIKEQSGIQFDPKIVDVFMEMVEAGEMN